MRKKEKIRLLEMTLMCTYAWLDRKDRMPKIIYKTNAGSASGLCSVISRMRKCGMITLDERIWLATYIKKKAVRKDVHTAYYWPVRDRESRIEFLIKRIKKLRGGSYMETKGLIYEVAHQFIIVEDIKPTRQEKIRLLSLLLAGTYAWFGESKENRTAFMYGAGGGSPLSGLCAITGTLRKLDIITGHEERWIDGYLRKKKGAPLGQYAWEKGKRKPRVKFLKKCITKLIKKEKKNAKRRKDQTA